MPFLLIRSSVILTSVFDPPHPPQASTRAPTACTPWPLLPAQLLIYMQTYWIYKHAGSQVLPGFERPQAAARTVMTNLSHLSTIFRCLGREGVWNERTGDGNPTWTKTVQLWKQGYKQKAYREGNYQVRGGTSGAEQQGGTRSDGERNSSTGAYRDDTATLLRYSMYTGLAHGLYTGAARRLYTEAVHQAAVYGVQCKGIAQGGPQGFA